jgi:hypothetical protein
MVANDQIITTIPFPIITAAFGQEVPLASIKLKDINRNDREELTATIVWNFGFPFAGSVPQINVASQQMQFTIWRDAPLTGQRLCRITDSGHITEVLLSPPITMRVNNTVTTTFSWTDLKISGKHKYFLTAAAGVPSGFTVNAGDGGGGPVPVTTFSIPAITAVHFSGAVIDENET